MKPLQTLLVFCLIALPGPALAQTAFICGTDGSQPQILSPTETHGIYLPAQGDLKVLLVFARFKDDVSDHFDWPVNSDPYSYSTWIDPTMQTGSTRLVNFTNYYKQMSGTTYRITGTAVSVATPRNRADYIPVGQIWPDRYLANREVIEQRVDPLVNFAEFDNWAYDADYTHRNVPDGIVDMIVMIWRGKQFAADWAGEASLGYGAQFTVEGGTKTITTNYLGSFFNPGRGSGVTIHYLSNGRRDYTFHSCIHEVAHWLLGRNHPYGSSGNYTKWAMMGGSYEDGLCANTYERGRLGWITASNVPGDGNLTDFITTGDALKYHPTGGDPNEYYYFENHQKLSVYDDATTNPDDKGIFVLHQRDLYNETNNIRIRAQDGSWNWDNPFYDDTFFPAPPPDPVFRKASVNRNSSGRSIRDQLLSTTGYAWPNIVLDPKGKMIAGGFFRGDPPFFSAFNLTRNKVFSRYSSPTANTWADVAVNFAMEITGQNGSTITMTFYTTNPLDASPSKPQFLQVFVVGPTGNNHPQLTWTANIENDMASYKIYRAYGVAGTYVNLATVSHPTTSWIDYSIHPGNYDTAYYKIAARDNTGKESSFSDAVWIKSDVQRKIGTSPDETVQERQPTEFVLHQNYPNPLNPSTTIEYELPLDIHISLSVHDILGREVATLVKGHQTAGLHSVVWDGSSVASGVYYVRMVASDGVGNVSFTRVNKIVLMK